VLIPAAAWWVQRHEGAASETPPDDGTHGSGTGSAGVTRSRPPVLPLFVLGFIGFIVVRTVGDALHGAAGSMWPAIVNTGYTASEVFLTCGMTAVGLSVSFTDMWRIGWRPLAAGFVVAILVGSCSLLLTCGMVRFLT
jgi:uncharacterized membrane protein YadS